MFQNRSSQSQQVRVNAAQLAAGRPPVQHHSNGEEFEYRSSGSLPSFFASFTKGLPHDPESGLVANPIDFELLVTSIQTGDPVDFRRVPLGPDRESGQPPTPMIPDSPSDSPIGPGTLDRTPYWRSDIARHPKNKPSFDATGEAGVRVRAWESAGAGNVFDLEGPDAQSVTMPPAPRLDDDELTAEMAEVYAMALLRDLPFSDFHLPGLGIVEVQADRNRVDAQECVVDSTKFDAAYEMLAPLPWFSAWNEERSYSSEQVRRRRPLEQCSDTFRGVTPGERVGPYLSQFLLTGNRGLGGIRQPADGKIAYGSIEIDLRVRTATPQRDYMTTWPAYLDSQMGADLRGEESYVDDQSALPTFRFIATPRDLATYVHYDALYEAYLNACLNLLAAGVPFDPGMPFVKADAYDRQQGFAHFGGPHILTLVCEVATRALKAVRYQKFNVHRRLRPEAVGGRVDRWMQRPDLRDGCLRPLTRFMNGDGTYHGFSDLSFGEESLLDAIKGHNAKNNARDEQMDEPGKDNASHLLPMAFPEGSPMHPSYGAGHGTVAGACVTILKAYFDHGWTPDAWLQDETSNGCKQPIAYYPTCDGRSLNRVTLEAPLTIEGELNKLAGNIAIGRNWAGVHYYSDYIESLRLGERIAIQLLEEQKLTYPENFSFTVPLFDGGTVRV